MRDIARMQQVLLLTLVIYIMNNEPRVRLLACCYTSHCACVRVYIVCNIINTLGAHAQRGPRVIYGSYIVCHDQRLYTRTTGYEE